MDDGRWQEVNQETQAIWEQNASFWDSYIGEGNDFHRQLVEPTVLGLLDLQEGEVVLEVACGNGNFARRLASLGAKVVACDFSQTFIERARSRTSENADRIEYHVVDATQREKLVELGKQRFDVAACNMALMDISDIEPLMDALTCLLKPGGRFVFSIMHPCFNSMNCVKVAEESDRDGVLITRFGITTWGYITPNVQKGLGIIGQPEPHHYFHRPLSMLLQTAFRVGFVMDGIEEPVFDGQTKATRPLSWDNFGEIPPVLTVGLRLLGRTAD